jgi:hypothetical protein
MTRQNRFRIRRIQYNNRLSEEDIKILDNAEELYHRKTSFQHDYIRATMRANNAVNGIMYYSEIKGIFTIK